MTESIILNDGHPLPEIGFGTYPLRGDEGFAEPEHQDYDIAPWSSAYGANVAAGDVNADGCGDVAFIDGHVSVRLALGTCGG